MYLEWILVLQGEIPKSNKLHLKDFQEKVGKFKENAENWILVFPRGNRSNKLHLKDF